MAAKKIKWSAKAVKDKLAIFDYWLNRNKSNSYSRKLNELFDKALATIIQNPESGRQSDYQAIRIKIVSHYLIFYRIQPSQIEIIRIWDSRRNNQNIDL